MVVQPTACGEIIPLIRDHVIGSDHLIDMFALSLCRLLQFLIMPTTCLCHEIGLDVQPKRDVLCIIFSENALTLTFLTVFQT